jgi:hypothetical protein
MSARIPVFSDRPKAAPTPKLRALVKFPSNLVGTTGIEVTKQNGTYTIETDWSGFPSVGSVPSSSTNNVLSFDTVTGVYSLIPTPLLTGVIANTPDAGVLTGSTLASNVVNSSLTKVGTLTSGSTGTGFTIDLSHSTIAGTLPIVSGGTGATSATTALANLGGLP